MPLRIRRSVKFKNFNFPISYKTNAKDRFKDARNVYTNQGVLETKHGISRWNAVAFDDVPKSITYYKDDSSNRKVIIKDGTSLKVASETGSHTEIKTGLTAANKHRGVTYKGRHIIVCGADGFFQYNGTTFTSFSQAAPTAPTVGKTNNGATLPAATYQVAVTYFDSVTGFETTVGTASASVTISLGEQIDVSAIPTTVTNEFIDKVRIYVKEGTGEWLFWQEIDKGTTTNTIDEEITSTITPPTKNGTPPTTGGAKYIVLYGNRIALLGNETNPSDVFLSEPYLFEAYDRSSTDKTFTMGGNGPITGGGSGYYSDANQTPYLVVFKSRSIELHTEISGSAQIIQISNEIGCISHDTIKTIDGDVYFMSHQGWHIISNGSLVKTKDESNSIDGGDIRDIFTKNGFVFELNKQNFSNFFSIYYPTLDQYMTFVSEGGNNFNYKSYNFEAEIGGFRAYDFPVYFTGGVLVDEANGDDAVYLIGESGYIYSHSINEEVGTDVDRDGNSVAVEAFAQLYWMNGEDMDASFNFGAFILRALSHDTAATVKYWLNYSTQSPMNMSYDFSSDEDGFVLDVDKLDEGILGDNIKIVRYVGDILRSGQSLLIGIYMSAQGESLGLIDGQMDIQKNGNPN